MISQRLRVSLIVFFLTGLIVIGRLFYWQILSGDKLAALAQSQYKSQIEIPAQRGKIITSDNFSLVSNQPAFLLYAYLPELTAKPEDLADKLAPILRPDPEEATSTAAINLDKQIRILTADTEASLSARLDSPRSVWIPLARKLPESKKVMIEQLNLVGLGFEPEPNRYYPEASTAAHLLGFVGSDSTGNPKGYFGLEGFYDLELRGRSGIIRQEKDASGKPILVGSFGGFESKNGRSLKLHLDRSVQRLIEIELEKALTQYGAVSGDVLIMDPKTGGIIASASLPKYDPQKFSRFDKALYKNPIVADAYEPGSTFKVLTMSAALDAGAVKPDTKCEICTGPVEIGQYTVKTWNEKYYPDSTMTEVIQHSDNVGMVFMGQKLGKEKMYEYLKNFGIGETTGIDLQEEFSPPLRSKNKWADIDLAATSFGQGVAVTSIQMLRAVAAIANQGILMEPHVAQEIVGDKTITINPKAVRRVISQDTAHKMTAMMVNAVDSGEAQWTKLKGYRIAGKTGTAQIAVAGHYDKEKTIASFVGFAPAGSPRFAMLVRLREPSSSIWAADTAAPLWMKIAKQLFLYYGIPPESP